MIGINGDTQIESNKTWNEIVHDIIIICDLGKNYMLVTLPHRYKKGFSSRHIFYVDISTQQ